MPIMESKKDNVSFREVDDPNRTPITQYFTVLKWDHHRQNETLILELSTTEGGLYIFANNTSGQVTVFLNDKPIQRYQSLKELSKYMRYIGEWVKK